MTVHDGREYLEDDELPSDASDDADVFYAPVDPNRGSSIGGLTHEEYQEQGATRTRPE